MSYWGFISLPWPVVTVNRWRRDWDSFDLKERRGGKADPSLSWMGKNLNTILDTNHLNYQLELGRQHSPRMHRAFCIRLLECLTEGYGGQPEIMHPPPGSSAQGGPIGVNPEGHRDVRHGTPYLWRQPKIAGDVYPGEVKALEKLYWSPSVPKGSL